MALKEKLLKIKSLLSKLKYNKELSKKDIEIDNNFFHRIKEAERNIQSALNML